MKNKLKVIIVLVISLMLSGCQLPWNKQTESDYINQAEINAIKYISYKYGVEALPINVICHKGDDGVQSNKLTGIATVEMRHDENYFEVEITCTESINERYENYHCYDNYMQDEISQAAKEYINTLISVNMVDVEYEYSWDNNLTSSKFDGDIEKFINDQKFKKFNIITYDSELPEDLSILDSELNVFIISYDEKFIKENREVNKLDVNTNSMWINWYIQNRYENDKKKVVYDKQIIDNFIIVYDDSGDIRVGKSNVDAKSWQGKGIKDPKQVGTGIKATTNCKCLKVYSNRQSEVELGQAYKYGASSVYKIAENHQKVGGYHYWEIPLNWDNEDNHEVDLLILRQ